MFRFLSIDQYLTSFLIGFSLMFALHYLLEPTWGVDEKRPRRRRMILNYVIGTLGIGLSFLYLHPHLWFDLLISMAGAGSAGQRAKGTKCPKGARSNHANPIDGRRAG